MGWLRLLQTVTVLGSLASGSARFVPSDDETCNTPACQAIAKQFLANIDSNVDPCENFYMHSCGKFVADELPPGVNIYGQINIIGEEVQSYINEEIKKPVEAHELMPFKHLKNYYKSCMDSAKLETLGVKPYGRFVSSVGSYGGWPLIQENYSGKTYDPMVVEAATKRLFGISGALIDSRVVTNVYNTSTNVFALFPPNTASFFKYTKQNGVRDYKDVMKWVAKKFLDDGNLSIDEEELDKRIEDAIKFEQGIGNFIRQANLRTLPEPGPEHDRELAELFTSTRTDFLASVDLLEYYMPKLGIKKYFEKLYEGVDYTFPTSELNIMVETDYMYFLQDYLKETPVKDQANYHHWKFITNYLLYGPGDFSKLVIGNGKRSDICPLVASGQLDWAQSRVYVESKFTHDARAEADDLVDNLRASFKQLVDKSAWLTEKDVAKEKVEYMVQNLAYPDWLMDDREFIDYHAKLKVVKPDTFLENAIGIGVWKQGQNLDEMIRKKSRDVFVMPPSLVNAAYSPILNSITFPAAILQSPFFDVGHPRYLNYGAIGTVIGHEITHGFDNSGRQFDKLGNLVQWWSDATIETFNGLVDCFVDQYSSFTIPELGSNVHLSGTNTLGENIADNGGIREAFNAYQMQQTKAAKRDPKLPGLEKYSREQMFFLSFGHTWCTRENAQGFISDLMFNVHAPGRYRVLGSAMNSEEFSEAFGCKKGSPMNPAKKCVLW